MSGDYRRCAELIGEADGLLVTAGAGIGVDSGLPDFRGPQGFWGAYPALGRARIAFEQIANPAAFAARPRLAWGFYGHRLALYRRTVPHEGFAILRRIGERMGHGAFVFTSNVDGQFQKAGFASERISECHGSIHHLQCLAGCHEGIWPADDFAPQIDDDECLLTGDFPCCPRCSGIARPNILMFGDWGWLSERSDAQERRLDAWLRTVDRLLVIEIGAGTRIPTARLIGERLPGRLIRINPTEPQMPPGKGVSLAEGGLAALRAIAGQLG
ncbi:Sir2 family NAD-dependent protein deacetylase [Accumulibacter sp.]|uniref:SIR2 family NAD-dependent protein deacylase n=1 Tax=Accumulibacter sp. TaxID=2053492 RepID=UPI0025F4BE58|nr:Sir2 family NAD-dependent protein deacetylase [Accumulibacter sp.]MCM8595863.1 NAD-dependent deacetylase [Accumulibacter sp.]MDS4050011.1 Sir2 family NAD-dependent protein deacetylase [Accumulibacter sp.]